MRRVSGFDITLAYDEDVKPSIIYFPIVRVVWGEMSDDKLHGFLAADQAELDCMLDGNMSSAPKWFCRMMKEVKAFSYKENH